MSNQGRLDRLMPGLSARERAVLILESWKRDEEEDPLWRRTMPTYQTREFNRLIDLMNGSVLQMGQYITFLEQQVDKLELRQCWLVALVLWDEQVTAVRRAARVALKEPISQGEYDAKQAELDEEWVPVSELADVLAGRHESWVEADYEETEEWPEPVISDEAWERVRAEKEKVLRTAVASGQLAGRGRGSSLSVQEGAFNVWAGTSSAPVPEDLLFYRVVPDSDAEVVASERAAVARLCEALEWRPLRIKGEEEKEGVLAVLSGHLRGSLAGNFGELWQAVRAVDVVLAEVAAEFEGADPLRPAKREKLGAIRGRMLGLAEQLIWLDVEIELTEPDEELLDVVRRMVRLD